MRAQAAAARRRDVLVLLGVVLAAALPGVVGVGVAQGAESNPTRSFALVETWGARGAEPGQFRGPMGLAVDGDGRLLVADSGNSRIQVFGSNGVVEAIWSFDRGTRPVAVAVAPDGRVFVADYTGDQILVLDPEGRIVDTWGTTGTDPGQLRAPSGLAALPGDELLVVEFMGQRLQVFDARGQFVRYLDGGDRAADHVASRPQHMAMEGMSMAPPGNRHGLFVYPSDAAIDSHGRVVVTNSHAYEIVVLSLSGDFLEAWGGKGAQPGEWEVPVGIAVDDGGVLGVADSANFRIQLLDARGAPLLASRVDELWYRADLPVYAPTGIAFGRDDLVYASDFPGNRVHVLRRVRIDRPGVSDDTQPTRTEETQ